MVRNVTNPREIPGDILERLDEYCNLLYEFEFLEQLLDETALAEIAAELDALCVADGVVGIHYARGFIERIENQGLVVRTGDERRQEFLARFSDRFTAAQRERLIAGWIAYFNRSQNTARDGRIWFNLTTTALYDGGAEPLLYHYGGEVIYMPFKRDKEIAEILHSIGEPMIVECGLNTRELRTFPEIPWGSVWLSTYHGSVNPEAHQFDVDTYATESIPASNVIAIRSVNEGL